MPTASPHGKTDLPRLGLLPSVHELAARFPDARLVSDLRAVPTEFLCERQDGALCVWRVADKAAPFTLDFVSGQLGYRLAQGRARQETLVRAILGRYPVHETRVLDATAGLGRDASLLAAAGIQVTALERDPLLFALLEDALGRAATLEWRQRLQLQLADARHFLAGLAVTDPFDVIYLDPMFAVGDSRAQVKKELVWLKAWLPAQTAEDDAILLQQARCHAKRRVVVKRAAKAPVLGGVAPTASLNGKAVRFDIYTPL